RQDSLDSTRRINQKNRNHPDGAKNMAGKRPKTSQKAAKKTPVKKAPAKAKPKLLYGGNPQIAKGTGDAPVKAYIAAAPGWKRDVCRRVDVLIVQNVPGVQKAVKWNSPFYGRDGQGW